MTLRVGEGDFSSRHVNFKFWLFSSLVEIVPITNHSLPLNKSISSNELGFLYSSMDKGGYVYMMTNKYKTTLYIGVTSDLRSRVLKHRQHFYPDSFTSKYNLSFCIFYEQFSTILEAINREKELKKWRRDKKNQLINTINPTWNDLWEEIQKK